MRVLISGCGYVGGALAKLLASEGYEVFGLRRDPSKLPYGVTPVRADFTDEGSLERALPESLDYVFHTASPGASGASTASEREYAYRDAYVLGPSNLISALRSRGESPRRIIMTSSTGVYAQTGGGWVDESSATEPDGPARHILEGESLMAEAAFSAVALRLAGIYGPGRTGALDRARRYRLADSSSGGVPYTNRIHRDDCAGALRHLALLQSPEDFYIGADHEPSTPAAVAAWLAESYPEARREDSARTVSDAGGSGRGSRTNKRCDNAQLVASGYEFRYPTFREGFASLLDEQS